MLENLSKFSENVRNMNGKLTRSVSFRGEGFEKNRQITKINFKWEVEDIIKLRWIIHEASLDVQ